MVNNWGIPDWLEQKVRKRDKQCVYCHVKFKSKDSDKASWEHINNNGPSDREWNIALCCNSCNRHKLTKKLLQWFDSDYCKKNNINKKTVAPIIKKYIESHT
jgi:5-methylcytosine-specific restriction endonuclease McrA